MTICYFLRITVKWGIIMFIKNKKILGTVLLLSMTALSGCNSNKYDIYETRTQLSLYHVFPKESFLETVSELDNLDPTNSDILSSYRMGNSIDIYQSDSISNNKFAISSEINNSSDTFSIINDWKSKFNIGKTPVDMSCETYDGMFVSPKMVCMVNGVNYEKEISTPENWETKSKIIVPLKDNGFLVISYLSHSPKEDKSRNKFEKLHDSKENLIPLIQKYKSISIISKDTYQFVQN